MMEDGSSLPDSSRRGAPRATSHTPRVEAIGRRGSGTAVGASSGSSKESSRSAWSEVMRSGNRRPGRTCTAKISRSPSSNRRKATIWPVRMSITQTPHVPFGQPIGDRDAAEIGGVAHLRQADERERAEEVQPSGEAG